MAEQGAGTYTAESLNQLRLLEACAGAAGRTGVRVLLRLTSGNQFGMDEEDILASIRNRDSYPIWTWQASSTIPEPEKGDGKDRERAGQAGFIYGFCQGTSGF